MQTSRVSFFVSAFLVVMVAVVLLPLITFAAGTWTNKAPLPSAKYGPVAGAIGDKLYVAGGVVSGCTSLDTLKIYDSTTDSWSDGASMPGPRHSASAAVIDGKLYVAGGSSSSCSDPGNASLFEYDPVGDSWLTKASMPTPRVGAGAATLDGKLYVLGGANGGAPINTFEMYDPTTNAWTAKASFPTGISGPVLGVINGKLYAAGGLVVCCTASAALWEYDPTTNTWTSKASLPEGRNSAAGGGIDGTLYVAGGGDQFNTDSLFAYDAGTNSWTTDEPMTEVRAAHAAAVIDGKLYVVGGAGASGLALSLLEFEPTIAPPTTGTLIVEKVIVNSASTTNQFAFLVNGGPVTPFETDGENSLELTPGTYNVVEAFRPWFTPTFNNCKGVVLDAGETETCTITNTAIHSPEISGDLTGTVIAGSAETALGQLGANQTRIIWTAIGGTNTNPSATFSYVVDNLTETVNGSTLFDNPFDVAPPAGPVPVSVFGTWSASGGKAFLAQSGAAQNFSALGDAVIQVSGTFLTNFNANVSGGLRSNNDFSIDARFDLIVPSLAGSNYAMVLTDGASPNVPNQNIFLNVGKSTVDGIVRVSFAEDNFNTEQRIVISRVPLTPAPGDDQIVLHYNHVAGTHEITASFDLLDNGVVMSSTPMPGVAQSFDYIDLARAVIAGSALGTLESQRVGTYGTLTLAESTGAWDYELGVTPAQQTAIANLVEGSSVTDNFNVQAKHYSSGPGSLQALVINVEKPTAAQTIESLNTTIAGMGLPAGVASSLSATLGNINTNNANSACGKVGAFINKVNDSLQNGELTQAQANQLLQAAGYIQTSLGCSV